ncbi:MAG: 23S rRNA (guanosine(2251)-2'-O)-methyltransferase RlmB [Firmicutes bacterium]|nr:23S rRNA (guanosine(2251)-2'-O)-methyltransferase RlmB [Bacillota bacterium]
MEKDNCGKTENSGSTYVCGRNAVTELLRGGRSVDKIFIRRDGRGTSLSLIAAEAIKRGIPLIETDIRKLDELASGALHQGVVALASAVEYVSVDDILEIAAAKGEKPLIVIADCIEDPQNLGALIRSAETAGAHGVIIPKRRSSGLTEAAERASAGALEHVAVAKVANLAAAVDDLKKKGLWIYAAEVGGNLYYETDFDSPAAIIFGSEGSGVSRLLKDKSDFTVTIPMYGLVNSLNVSAAAAVILCEAARQRHKS